MLSLLQDIAVDSQEAIGRDNPLRQVIVNTHSPVVVREIPDDSLLLAQLRDTVSQGKHFKGVRFSYLSNTWRADKIAQGETASVTSPGEVLRLLSPIKRGLEDQPSWERQAVRRVSKCKTSHRRSVADRAEEWLIPEASLPK